jgi:hypothetical protein
VTLMTLRQSGRSVRIALIAAWTAAILASPVSVWFGYQLAAGDRSLQTYSPVLEEATAAREHAEGFGAQLSEYARADLAAVPADARADLRARITRAHSTFEFLHSLANGAYVRGDYEAARAGYENAVRSAQRSLRLA